MPGSSFNPIGQPLTPEQLAAIATIKRKDVTEAIRLSKGLKPYLIAQNQQDN